MRFCLFIFFVLSLCTACEKVSDEAVFDLTPRIELIDLSTDTLRAFEDRLRIRIRYEDGDGDLGHSDPDINTIFVKDSRLENADEYYLGPLAPEGSDISIQGSLNLELSPTFLLGNGSEESAIYTIYLLDRAGQQSNTITTPTITILSN